MLAVSGIIGPIVYAVVVGVLGFLQPDYSHVSQTMSELGADGARYPLVMNTAGLPLLGLSAIALAVGLHHGVGSNRGAWTGPALIAVAGACLIMAAVFPCDPGGVDRTTTGTVHGIFAGLAAAGAIFGLLALSLRFRGQPEWRGYAGYSLATMVLSVILACLFGLSPFDEWRGALQRAAMALPLVWMVVVGSRLLRLR